MTTIPEGYEPIFRSSPFIELIGPVYCRKENGGWRIGLRAEDKHCNQRGTVHGGVFTSLADIALGYNAAFQSEPPTPLVTVNLSVDYIGSAQLGDWLEIVVDVPKVGRQNGFASAYFFVGDKQVARASAVFSVIAR